MRLVKVRFYDGSYLKKYITRTLICATPVTAGDIAAHLEAEGYSPERINIQGARDITIGSIISPSDVVATDF